MGLLSFVFNSLSLYLALQPFGHLLIYIYIYVYVCNWQLCFHMISKNSSVDPTIPTSITISISSNKAFRQILWQHRSGLERRRGGWFLAPLPSSKDISSKNVIEKKSARKDWCSSKNWYSTNIPLSPSFPPTKNYTTVDPEQWHKSQISHEILETQHPRPGGHSNPSPDGRQGRRQEKDKTRKADTAKADTHKIALRTPTVNCLGKILHQWSMDPRPALPQCPGSAKDIHLAGPLTKNSCCFRVPRVN